MKLFTVVVKNVRWLICFLGVMTLLCNTAYAERSIRVEVQVSDGQKSDSQLTLDLKNTGTETISFNIGNLPWSGTIFSGFRLFVVPMNVNSSPLRRAHSLRNPIGKTEILPNKQLSGAIDLNKEFPELRQARKKGDVVIFWSYSPVTEDNQQLPPMAAALILKQHQNENNP